MKSKTISLPIMSLAALSLLFLTSCGSADGSSSSPSAVEKSSRRGSNANGGNSTYAVADQQKADMLFMWEEEKLARDVYVFFINKWGSRVFVNISSAEQRHMDAIARLLVKYNIDLPTDPEQFGVFNDASLQTLYNNLTKAGSVSEKAAFGVGRDIEVLDIKDLQDRIATASPDVKAVYKRLLRGSYKHLSAFERQLRK